MFRLSTGYVKNYLHIFKIEERIWKLKDVSYIKKTDLKRVRIPKTSNEWLTSNYQKYILPIKGEINFNIWCNKSNEIKQFILTPNKFVFENEFTYDNTPMLVLNPNVYHQIISQKSGTLFTMYNCNTNLDLSGENEFDKIVSFKESLNRRIMRNGGL